MGAKQIENIEIDYDDVVTFHEIATRFGKSLKTVDRMSKRGLWSFKIGGDRVTTKQKLNEFLKREAARSNK